MELGVVGAGAFSFGSLALIGITRGIAEFHAGRPVLITNESATVAALPVE